MDQRPVSARRQKDIVPDIVASVTSSCKYVDQADHPSLRIRPKQTKLDRTFAHYAYRSNEPFPEACARGFRPLTSGSWPGHPADSRSEPREDASDRVPHLRADSPEASSLTGSAGNERRSNWSLPALHALLVTLPEQIRYFTGFHTELWTSPTRPWYVVLPADGDKPIAVIPDEVRPAWPQHG